MRTHTGTALVFLCLLWLAGCGNEGSGMSYFQADSTATQGGGPTAPRGCQIPFGRSTVTVEGHEVDLLMPEDKYVGDLLILPPWNVGRAEWCMHGRLCTKALKKGYRVIMPEMGKSIYAQTAYPETRQDWQEVATIKWVKERLIPDLRNNYCLLKEDGQNFVVGASAGARGAILLAEEMPGLFVAVAALSGDYDPSEMKGDNIYRGFLGDYDAFQQRWETAENVLVGTNSIRAAVYLGHGKADDVVAYSQTLKLYQQLQAQRPALQVSLNLVDDRGNDFAYWGSEVGNVLDFFESLKASGPEAAMQ